MRRPPLIRSLVTLLLVLSAAAFVVGVIIERSQSGESSGVGAPAAPTQAAVGPTSTTHAESGSAPSPTVHNETGEVGGETSIASPTAPSEGDTGESAATLATESAARAGRATPTPGSTGESGAAESAATLANEAVANGAPHVETAGEHHAEAKLFGVNPESTALVVIVALLSIALAAAGWRSSLSALLIGAVVFGLIFAAFDIREAVHQSDESHHGLMVLAIAIAVLHVGVALVAALGKIGRGPMAATPDR